MKTLLLLCAGLAHVLGAQSAPNSEMARQLVAARDTVWGAWFANDTTLLHRYIPAAAATLDDPGAHWGDRNEIMNGAKAFASAKGRLVGLEFSNTQISQAGHSALVRSNYVFV